jgi:lysozyme
MNLISKTVCGLMIITLVILSITMFNILETNRENNKLYNKLNLLLATKSSYKPTSPKPKITDNQSKNELRGIDVSHWNGNVRKDLPSRDDLNFVICKSTQGEHEIDSDFTNNWKFLTEKNIMKGTYHFYMYPLDPIKQATHFYNIVGQTKAADFPLIIDIEEKSLHKKYIDRYRLKNDLLKFLLFIEQKTDRTPIIYSNYSFINQYLNDDEFSKYPLWLAEYSHTPKPSVPNAWKETGCLIWQKTDRYDIHSSDIDFDIYFK